MLAVVWMGEQDARGTGCKGNGEQDSGRGMRYIYIYDKLNEDA